MIFVQEVESAVRQLDVHGRDDAVHLSQSQSRFPFRRIATQKIGPHKEKTLQPSFNFCHSAYGRKAIVKEIYPRRRRISSEIAGTILCRSPMTAYPALVTKCDRRFVVCNILGCLHRHAQHIFVTWSVGTVQWCLQRHTSRAEIHTGWCKCDDQ